MRAGGTRKGLAFRRIATAGVAVALSWTAYVMAGDDPLGLGLVTEPAAIATQSGAALAPSAEMLEIMPIR